MSINMNAPYLIDFGIKGNTQTGFISIVENGIHGQCPFDIKRVYWVYNSPDNITRGNHAYKNLHKIMIAVAGKVIIHTESAKGGKDEFLLDAPYFGLYLPDYHWINLDFSTDAVLLVLASKEFSEDEYIRDYEAFRTLHD